MSRRRLEGGELADNRTVLRVWAILSYFYAGAEDMMAPNIGQKSSFTQATFYCGNPARTVVYSNLGNCHTREQRERARRAVTPYMNCDRQGTEDKTRKAGRTGK